jgi:hypothetical protein
MRSGLLFLLLCVACLCGCSQVLSIDQLTVFPLMQADHIGAELLKSGWTVRNLEFVPDSNFVRRSWEIKNKRTEVKEYFIHYEFTRDTNENYIIYQFGDRDVFLKYKEQLKSKGYKLISEGKTRKRKKKEQDVQKEKDDLFYNEKQKTLTVVKEVFFYGLYSFMVYSYKPNSVIAQHTMQAKSTADH